MQERGVFVNHVKVYRWTLKVLPVLIKVAGQWKCLDRAVDCESDTVDFLLTAKRDFASAAGSWSVPLTCKTSLSGSPSPLDHKPTRPTLFGPTPLKTYP